MKAQLTTLGGEIPLYPGEVCDLGAINLSEYVADLGHGIMFDWQSFRTDVRTAFRYLDANLSYCRYPTKDAERMSARNRRVGLGIMGLGDALVKLGLRYDSRAGCDFAADVMAEMSHITLVESEMLAVALGEPEFSALIGDSDPGWVPRRNVATLTVAPTGTTSMVMGCSSGIEPIFSPFVYRKVGAEYKSYIHPLLKELLDRHAADWLAPHLSAEPHVGGWDWGKVQAELQTGHGSIQGFDWIPQEIREVFLCAHDVSPRDHVLMQGAAQSGMDSDGVGNALSKTINLPGSASVKDVLEAYTLAWKDQCKGITVYRDGSRQFQPLSTSETVLPEGGEETPAAEGETHDEFARLEALHDLLTESHQTRHPRRPNPAPALNLKVRIGEEAWYLHPGYGENGEILEVFVSAPKGNASRSTTASVLGRLLSWGLKHGAPLEDAVKHLLGQSDATGGWLNLPGEKPSYASSSYDGLGKALQYLIERPNSPSGSAGVLVAPWVPLDSPPAAAQEATVSRSTLTSCDACGNRTFDKTACVCHACGNTRCG